MKIIEKILEMKSWSNGVRAEGFRLGFVPTMGALHEGHFELIKKAQLVSDLCIVSIFVNPLQFNTKEDSLKYPRQFEKDCKKLKSLKVDVVFQPKLEEMCPKNFQTQVLLPELSQVLCGKFRPGHFQGVATIVTKLFHIVKPHYAVFGQKDYQQLLLILRMVEDLNLDIDIVSIPTVRNAQGLALSSRNALLSSEGLTAAQAIPAALKRAQELFQKGVVEVEEIEKKVVDFIDKESSLKLEYFEIRDAVSLEKYSIIRSPVVCAIAAYVESVRLIDNVVLKEKE
ncbi:MAG: pantoate--beta-alanine ligase [Deltaproteobacteria bacterium]|nr:pantoate--beta-alanine ligase [Deltaproteobacteria bacterium]